jgi:hypothetical protein
MRTLLAVTLALAAFTPMGAAAQAKASGHFRLGESRVDVKHVIAVFVPADQMDQADNVHLYLSAQPLDVAPLLQAFDPDDGLREQDAADAGYVRLCITADGGECGGYFSRRDPTESFSTSGYGELQLERNTPQRVTGRWLLAEPEDFMGRETYDYDLKFDVAISPTPGTALPSGGGEPGEAYRAWARAITAGDVATLRRMLGEDGEWRLPRDNPIRVKETLKELRDGQPIDPEVLRGRVHGDRATLWVRGVDRDELPQSGRVSMQRTRDGWRFVDDALEVVAE